MRLWAFLTLAVVTFAGLTRLGSFDLVPASLLQVACGIALAIAASGNLSYLSIAGGAIGALGMGFLSPTSAALGGAVFLACVYFERTSRIADRSRRTMHLGLAVLGGALAAHASQSFLAAAFPVLCVSLLVSAALAALPQFIDADDPVTYKLSVASASLPGDLGKELASIAELRRQTQGLPLESSSKDTVESSWRALAELVETRMIMGRTSNSELTRSIHEKTEEKILEVTRLLHRTLTASAKVRAIETNARDEVASKLEATGESLEEVERALLGENKPVEEAKTTG
jgi:hypothetical protein